MINNTGINRLGVEKRKTEMGRISERVQGPGLMVG